MRYKVATRNSTQTIRPPNGPKEIYHSEISISKVYPVRPDTSDPMDDFDDEFGGDRCILMMTMHPDDAVTYLMVYASIVQPIAIPVDGWFM